MAVQHLDADEEHAAREVALQTLSPFSPGEAGDVGREALHVVDVLPDGELVVLHAEGVITNALGIARLLEEAMNGGECYNGMPDSGVDMRGLREDVVPEVAGVEAGELGGGAGEEVGEGLAFPVGGEDAGGLDGDGRGGAGGLDDGRGRFADCLLRWSRRPCGRGGRGVAITRPACGGAAVAFRSSFVTFDSSNYSSMVSSMLAMLC